MTNDQFKIYLAKRLDETTREIRSGTLEAEALAAARKKLETLQDMAKIANLGGARLRRVRRDYERRCADAGITLKP